jgi:acyl-CoA synthetase (NDP forming)
MSAATGGSTQMLPEPDAAVLLGSCGIQYVDHGVAETAEAAVEVAARIGYPVVLKVISADVVHKTDVGGVVTGLKDEGAVRAGMAAMLDDVRLHCPGARIDGALVARHVSGGRELIVGAVHDATFGPTVMVGLGGVFAEALADVVFRLAPLRREDGLDMLSELRGARLLAGFRGEPPVDLDAVADVIVNIGDLLVSHPEIVEIDLNPVAASAQGCVALDVRIIVAAPGGDDGAA